MSLDEFLLSIGMEGQHDQYYKAISLSTRGKILVLKRSISERMVNNYQPNFIKAWNANMDFQICLDHFAVISYITDYFTKADMNLTKQLKDALKDASGKDIAKGGNELLIFDSISNKNINKTRVSQS